MNKKTIEKAKKRYTELMKQRVELEEAKQLLKKQDISMEKLKSCLAIIDREENNLPSEEEIIKYSFQEVIGNNSECNIYVFRDDYRVKHNKKVVEVTDYTKAQYLVYFNLEEMCTGVVVYPQEQTQFEKDNIVLRFNNNSDFMEKFERLQCAYYREYLENPDISQERVLKKLNEIL